MTATATVLLVEDEALARQFVERTLREAGYEVVAAADPAEARRVIDAHALDLAFLDLGLGRDDKEGRRGREVFDHLQVTSPEVPVIVVTSHDRAETAVELLRRGAYDYVVKPIEPERLLHLAEMGLELSSARRALGALREMRRLDERGAWYVGQTPRMKSIEVTLNRVAPTDAGLLIEGESGTGKEIVARALHERSGRAEGPFVALNCSAVPRELLESELFGHEKGAFTGAFARKRGLLELAHGGTLLLDELTTMPPDMQAKLLRALQEFRFRRVGGQQEIKVDVRVVSAANRKVSEAIAAGDFRHDLFYRLCVMTVELPPLRDRAVDIPYFVELFLQEIRERMATTVTGVTDGALRTMMAYRWPGNIRELRNVVERAMILANGEELIDVVHLPDIVRGIDPAAGPTESEGMGWLPVALPEGGLDLKSTRDEWEKRLVVDALEREAGNQSAAARMLGLTRDELRYRVEKFGLQGT